MSRVLERHHRKLEELVKQRQMALSVCQQSLAKEEIIQRALLKDRQRQDEDERRHRAEPGGPLIDFSRERIRALLDRSISQSQLRLEETRSQLQDLQHKLRKAKADESAVNRLLERQAQRRKREREKSEQKVLEETFRMSHSKRATETRSR